LGAVPASREAGTAGGSSYGACGNSAGPLVVAIDAPSGLSDPWNQGDPVVRAGATLAIEPRKLCLYKPAARRFAGNIIPVGGIFPRPLINAHKTAEFLSWESVQKLLPPIAPDAHKYGRGLAEIRAGSAGSAGAARIAAAGAQAAGAGVVRLLVDKEIYPILAASAAGVMVAEAGSAADNPERFKPDAALLGPGWG